MRARVAFDTLAYANKLKAAGVEPKIAEVQAETNADMLAMLLEDGQGLATKQDVILLKQDVVLLKQEFKQDLLQTKGEFEQKLLMTEAKLEQRILSVESKLEQTATKQELSQVESRLKQDMKDLETRLTLRLGGIMVGGIAVLTTIMWNSNDLM